MNLGHNDNFLAPETFHHTVTCDYEGLQIANCIDASQERQEHMRPRLNIISGHLTFRVGAKLACSRTTGFI